MAQLKAEQSSIWTSPQKVALGRFKPETLRGSHSKVSSLHRQTNIATNNCMGLFG